jgi:RNA polymerase subunit RPABC4/transcription elongation factor Spt4
VTERRCHGCGVFYDKRERACPACGVVRYAWNKWLRTCQINNGLYKQIEHAKSGR